MSVNTTYDDVVTDVYEVEERSDGTSVLGSEDQVRWRDRSFVLHAVAQNGWALHHASDELKSDHAVVLAAVSTHGHAVLLAAEQLRDDKEIAFAAVTQRGGALINLGRASRADREIVLAAVSNEGSALEFAATTLQADRDVVLAAVRRTPGALQFACPKLWRDPALQAPCAARNPIAARGSPAPVIQVDKVESTTSGCFEASMYMASGQQARVWLPQNTTAFGLARRAIVVFRLQGAGCVHLLLLGHAIRPFDADVPLVSVIGFKEDDAPPAYFAELKALEMTALAVAAQVLPEEDDAPPAAFAELGALESAAFAVAARVLPEDDGLPGHAGGLGADATRASGRALPFDAGAAAAWGADRVRGPLSHPPWQPQRTVETPSEAPRRPPQRLERAPAHPIRQLI